MCRYLSVSDHAHDAYEVLTSCGFWHADVVLGHSMGTAVALELSLLYPDAVGSMILLNGFHGQALAP